MEGQCGEVDAKMLVGMMRIGVKEMSCELDAGLYHLLVLRLGKDRLDFSRKSARSVVNADTATSRYKTLETVTASGSRMCSPDIGVRHFDSLTTLSNSFRYSSTSLAPWSVKSLLLPSKTIYGTALYYGFTS